MERRRFIAAAGTATAALIAGCATPGDGDGEDGDGPYGAPESRDGTGDS